MIRGGEEGGDGEEVKIYAHNVVADLIYAEEDEDEKEEENEDSSPLGLLLAWLSETHPVAGMGEELSAIEARLEGCKNPPAVLRSTA